MIGWYDSIDSLLITYNSILFYRSYTTFTCHRSHHIFINLYSHLIACIIMVVHNINIITIILLLTPSGSSGHAMLGQVVYSWHTVPHNQFEAFLLMSLVLNLCHSQFMFIKMFVWNPTQCNSDWPDWSRSDLAISLL